jgi:signal transduction histidine kinase
LEYAQLTAADERNNLTSFLLQPLLEQIFQTYNASADARKVRLISRIAADFALRSDRIKLERILNNLIHNAIKFTSEGSVTVAVECTTNAVEIRVIDTGEGIAPEHQPNLFSEFFQAHNAERDRAKGFGLGLAIARRLALQLGGDLTFDSDPGRGTSFAILLPGANSAEPVTPA